MTELNERDWRSSSAFDCHRFFCSVVFEIHVHTVTITSSFVCRFFKGNHFSSLIPLGVYLATKVYMYSTWFLFFWPYILLFHVPIAADLVPEPISFMNTSHLRYFTDLFIKSSKNKNRKAYSSSSYGRFLPVTLVSGVWNKYK